MNYLNLEPYKQRLGEYRYYNGKMEVGKSFGVSVVDARRKMLDDLDDLIREVDRLRAEVAALREELDNLQDGAGKLS